MLDLLQGIRIISFNHFLLGPMGIQALADVGADVIAVETPEGAWQRHWSSGDIWHDGQGMVHMCTNRNKRSVALDLKSSKGKEIALKLIDGADVVAENFRPGVMDKLGFGYDALRRRKPSLIYASASGYGPERSICAASRSGSAGAGAIRAHGDHRAAGRPDRARSAYPSSTTMVRRCSLWAFLPPCCAGSAPARAAVSTRASCRRRSTCRPNR